VVDGELGERERDEHELPEAAHHGDEDAFRRLVETRRTPLLAYLRQPRPFTILMAHDEAGKGWVSGTGYDLRQEPPADFTAKQVADVIRAAAEGSRNLFHGEGEYWTIRYDGSVARFKDTKGLRLLALPLVDPGGSSTRSTRRRPAPPGARNEAGSCAVGRVRMPGAGVRRGGQGFPIRQRRTCRALAAREEDWWPDAT